MEDAATLTVSERKPDDRTGNMLMGTRILLQDSTMNKEPENPFYPDLTKPPSMAFIQTEPIIQQLANEMRGNEWSGYGNKRTPKKRSRPKTKSKQRGISPTLRFEILQRDKHRCGYCGQGVSENVVLEVDHIIPKSRGGTNAKTNLLTACLDCNRGKRDKIAEGY